MLDTLRLILAAWHVCAIPAPVTIATVDAAHSHGVDPVVMVGYLCSEHGDDWTPRPDACSDAGACGPFQLGRSWPLEFGYPMEARADMHASADMMARLVVYTQGRHNRCTGSHDWRAHLKAGPGGRDAENIAWSVRRWRGFEAEISARK